MAFSGEYAKELETLMEKMEIIYAPLMNAEEYHSSEIKEVVDSVFSFLETIPEEEEQSRLDAIQKSASETMGRFCLLAGRIRYQGAQVVVFDNFPNLLKISGLLFQLTKAVYAKDLSSVEYKGLLATMSYIDDEKIEFKYGLAYRVIKMTFLLTLYEAMAYASMFARFLLYQIALSLDIQV